MVVQDLLDTLCDDVDNSVEDISIEYVDDVDFPGLPSNYSDVHVNADLKQATEIL